MIKHISKFTKEDVLSYISDEIENVNEIKIITGYLTKKGFQKIIDSIYKEDIKKIKSIVIGVLTKEAKDAFDYIEKKYPNIKLYIYKFSEYKGISDGKLKFMPIMHAKIIAGYTNRKLKWAYQGSVNITQYALTDKNIEAGVFIKGNKELDSIRNTINKIYNKKNIIEYKDIKGKNIIFTPTKDSNIFFVEIDNLTDYFNLDSTYLLIVDDKLANDISHKKIGLYSNSSYIINDFRNDKTKVLLYFTKSNNLIFNKVTSNAKDNIFPQEYIDFYLKREYEESDGLESDSLIIIDNENFTFERYTHFIIIEDIKEQEIGDKYFDKIKDLIKIEDIDNLISEQHKLNKKDLLFDRIIVKTIKKAKPIINKNIDFKDAEYFDISNIDIIPEEVQTLNDYLNSNKNVDTVNNNHIFRLNKITT